ncbi:diaminopimelate decarboxylase [Candidatus Kaiserbacteria bacterium]|nr:diaminopimelate decarboxylase [Candidatus Kaiserbacteria bacterium]
MKQRKTIPFSKREIEALAKRFPTPFYIYDAEGIRRAARKFIGAFSWNPGFKEFFAIKATPTPAILKLLRKEGCGADCSSLPELLLAEGAGMRGESVIFTSNNTPAQEFVAAKKLGAIINLDDIGHIAFLEKHAGLPALLSFRYNPGRTHSESKFIGKPEETKFGMTRKQLFDSYAKAKAKGVKRFGLHMMTASNELNPRHFIETATTLFDIALELRKKLGIALEFVNLGGGIGIPYRPGEKEMDLQKLSRSIRALYEKRRLAPLKLQMECGRYITGPHGYLVSRVLHMKHTYKRFAGIDATMSSLMRPGMYGAYHHLSVLGKEKRRARITYDVVGSLCENNDKFATDRKLPRLEVDDLVVVHDAGAHGHTMGFNYNGKLRPAEFLLQNGRFTMIRRAQTIDDYFATLNF